jgi:hypothetical protein
MPQATMKPLPDSSTLVSSAELAEIVGTDLETVNNWIRRGIISRTPIGGRQLRNRLFSTEEVYKTALKNELVKLSVLPSSAHEAVNAIWKEWNKKEAPEGWNIYAVVMTSGEKWRAELCSQKESKGPLYKYKSGKATGTKSAAEMELPKQAFLVIPFSGILERVSGKLSELLDINELP